jgi:hypothetical protein
LEVDHHVFTHLGRSASMCRSLTKAHTNALPSHPLVNRIARLCAPSQTTGPLLVPPLAFFASGVNILGEQSWEAVSSLLQEAEAHGLQPNYVVSGAALSCSFRACKLSIRSDLKRTTEVQYLMAELDYHGTYLVILCTRQRR